MAVRQDLGPHEDPGHETRVGRLAEMVVHLSDCAPERALAAVRACEPPTDFDSDQALAIVARALRAVQRLDLRDAVDLRDYRSSAPTARTGHR